MARHRLRTLQLQVDIQDSFDSPITETEPYQYNYLGVRKVKCKMHIYSAHYRQQVSQDEKGMRGSKCIKKCNVRKKKRETSLATNIVM